MGTGDEKVVQDAIKSNWWDQILAFQVIALVIACSTGLVGVAVGPGSYETVRMSDLLIFGLFGGFNLPLALFLFSVAPRYIPTTVMGCVKMIEVVVFPLVMFIYEGEVPSLGAFVGGSLVVVAILGHLIATLRGERPSCE